MMKKYQEASPASECKLLRNDQAPNSPTKVMTNEKWSDQLQCVQMYLVGNSLTNNK